MTKWLFTARQRFTSSHTQDWHSYVQFSGFTHITEVVTLDSILCPDLIEALIDEDWSHNVHADCRVTWFTNASYLRQRINWRVGQDQLIATLEQPTYIHQIPTSFEFCGFDIVDDHDSNSVLTNCGLFSGIFNQSDINTFGLLSDIDQANTIAAQIRAKFPEDSHCRSCRVWQIARSINFS